MKQKNEAQEIKEYYIQNKKNQDALANRLIIISLVISIVLLVLHSLNVIDLLSYISQT